MMQFRLLKPSEIDVKVKQVCRDGIICLLYKTSRTDMDILDETVGPMNWDCDYRDIKGNLYCGIGVRENPEQPWVRKWDCGIESREDNEGNEKKGEASDAFKRAGFKWGIGRELYTSPFVWIPIQNVRVDNGKVKDSFSVHSIEYDESRRVIALSLVNQKGAEVFSWSSKSPARRKPATAPKEPAAPQFHKCSVCGCDITGVQFRNGIKYTAEEILQKSNEHFHQDMCFTCLRAAGENDKEGEKK